MLFCLRCITSVIRQFSMPSCHPNISLALSPQKMTFPVSLKTNMIAPASSRMMSSCHFLRLVKSQVLPLLESSLTREAMVTDVVENGD